MPISASNVVVLYQEGNADSLSFAEYYASFRGLSAIQLIGLPCSNQEILPNYAAFQSQIENPLSIALANEYVAALNPWVIIVGYGVPGGFNHNGSIISTQSRLSRIGHAPQWGLGNPFFNVTSFNPFDANAASIALIVSRFDAPTLIDAKAMVDGCSAVKRRGGIANGQLLFDKYAPIDTDEYGNQDSTEIDYFNDLVDFEDNLLPALGLTVFNTTYWNPTTDVVIPFAENDSFLWAWKEPRTGYSFFQPTTRNRIFLYNADLDGGGSMRNADDRRWPLVAMSSGYAATAGAMSDPLPEGYLRPKPFFNYLFAGATVGEAFLASCPNLDWTVGLFGDPLITCVFVGTTPIPSGYSVYEGFDLMNRQLQDSVGYMNYGETLLLNSYHQIMQSNNVNTIVGVSPSMLILYNSYAQSQSIFGSVITDFVNLVSLPSLSGFLTSNNLEMSQEMLNLTPNISLPSSLTYPQYSWYFETNINSESSEYSVYQFNLQVSLTLNFTQIMFSLSTANSVDNWFFERDINTFVAMPSSGVPSSFSGRRLRYIAPLSQYFTSNTIYYVRINQVDQFGTTSDWVITEQVVGT